MPLRPDDWIANNLFEYGEQDSLGNKTLIRKNAYSFGQPIVIADEILCFYLSIPSFESSFNVAAYGAVSLFGLPMTNVTLVGDGLYEQEFERTIIHLRKHDGDGMVYLPYLEAVYKRNIRDAIKERDGAYKEISRISKERDYWLYATKVVEQQLELILKQPPAQILAQIQVLLADLPLSSKKERKE